MITLLMISATLNASTSGSGESVRKEYGMTRTKAVDQLGGNPPFSARQTGFPGVLPRAESNLPSPQQDFDVPNGSQKNVLFRSSVAQTGGTPKSTPFLSQQFSALQAASLNKRSQSLGDSQDQRVASYFQNSRDTTKSLVGDDSDDDKGSLSSNVGGQDRDATSKPQHKPVEKKNINVIEKIMNSSPHEANMSNYVSQEMNEILKKRQNEDVHTVFTRAVNKLDLQNKDLKQHAEELVGNYNELVDAHNSLGQRHDELRSDHDQAKQRLEGLSREYTNSRDAEVLLRQEGEIMKAQKEEAARIIEDLEESRNHDSDYHRASLDFIMQTLSEQKDQGGKPLMSQDFLALLQGGANKSGQLYADRSAAERAALRLEQQAQREQASRATTTVRR